MKKFKRKTLMRRWSEQELALLQDTRLSNAEVARRLGRSVRSVESVRTKRQAPYVRKFQGPPKVTTLAQDKEEVGEQYWSRQFQTLNRKYGELLSERSATAQLVASIKELAPTAYTPLPTVTPHNRHPKSTPQSAVLELSDTHIGAEVSSTQTLSFGKYDFGVFLRRLKYLEDSVISIVTEHMTVDVPELHITVLGDMLDGALLHSNECGQVNPIFSQFYSGGHALAQFIRNVAQHFKKVRVHSVVGNHTRFQNQKKMPTKNKFSNFDNFLYAFVAALLRDAPNVEWELNDQLYQTFEIQGFSFLAFHGENLRGGDLNLGIPNHAIGRVISTTAQLFNKHQRAVPNYYLVGHLHRPITLPHATGEFIVNGGFVGVDTYALSSAFTPSDPMQKLFFMHPTYGKTATYDISLKFAGTGGAAPYHIPGEFKMI